MVRVWNSGKKSKTSQRLTTTSANPSATATATAKTTLFSFLLLVLFSSHGERGSPFCHSFSFDRIGSFRKTRTIHNKNTKNKKNIFSSPSNPIRTALQMSSPSSSSSSSSSDAVVSKATAEALAGRSVLLTGATGGLGAQLALQIAHHCSPSALVLSGRKPEALEAVADECRNGAKGNGNGKGSEARVVALTADLSDRESVLALGRSAVEACGGTVDVLIHCGGVSSRSDFVDTLLEVDERVMQINFFSGAALAKAVVPTMVAAGSGGKILWISSVQGLMGIPSRTSYAASKFAVQGYCEALRAELATEGISVHCASPGYIRTNLSASAVTGDGKAYGTTDPATAAGADPRDVAVEVLDRSVAKGEADFVVAASATARIALWLRVLLPGVLRSLLVRRYETARAKRGAPEAPPGAAGAGKKLD